MVEAGNAENVHQLELVPGIIKHRADGFAHEPAGVAAQLERVREQARANRERNEDRVIERDRREAPDIIAIDMPDDLPAVPGDFENVQCSAQCGSVREGGAHYGGLGAGCQQRSRDESNMIAAFLPSFVMLD